MTNNETTILASLLSLSDKVLSNDLNVDAEINSINAITANNTNYDSIISDTIDMLCTDSTKENYDVVVKIVSGLTSIASNKEVILAILEANHIDYNDTQAISEYVDKALASTINNFRYYTTVVRMAIVLGDSAKIKSAIDKIQSLGV
jgi:hypothetical protein